MIQYRKSINVALFFFSFLISVHTFVPTHSSISNLNQSNTGTNKELSTKFYKSQIKYNTPLQARPQDNLLSGLAEIGIGFSLGVLWSEYSIILTGCGPINFSDTLERICYQGVIALSGIVVYNRIVTGGKGLDESSIDIFGQLEEFTLIQVRIAEYIGLLAVLGAFVALAFQDGRGVNMDGLSGIDVSMCRAWRDM